jgi:anti-anti-sigma factor
MSGKEIEVERHESRSPEVTVYRLSGYLSNTPGSYEILEEVRRHVRKHPVPVVVNLENVDHVTSAGIGILAACYTTVVNSGQRFGLACVPKRVVAILTVVKFLDVVPSYASEDEAVLSLGTNSGS